jgi:hypothetical protein
MENTLNGEKNIKMSITQIIMAEMKIIPDPFFLS